MILSMSRKRCCQGKKFISSGRWSKTQNSDQNLLFFLTVTAIVYLFFKVKDLCYTVKDLCYTSPHGEISCCWIILVKEPASLLAHTHARVLAPFIIWDNARAFTQRLCNTYKSLIMVLKILSFQEDGQNVKWWSKSNSHFTPFAWLQKCSHFKRVLKNVKLHSFIYSCSILVSRYWPTPADGTILIIKAKLSVYLTSVCHVPLNTNTGEPPSVNRTPPSSSPR